MQTNIFNASSVALAAILGTILQAPNRFLGEAKIIALEEPQLALQGKVTIKSYQDEAALEQNPNFAYISKIVVAKDEMGTHTLIVTTKPIHPTVVRAIAGSFDPKVVKFGTHGIAVGRFFTPMDQVQFAYLVGPDGRILALNGETTIEYGKKTKLNATRFEVTRDVRGNIVIQALSRTGKVYRLQNLTEALVEENPELVNYDQVVLAKDDKANVTDFITVPTDAMETRTLYGTQRGLYYGDAMVPGTEKMDVLGLCIDAQNMDLLITTRQGMYTAKFNGKAFTKPEIIKGTEQVVNQPWFKDEVSVQALIGPMLPDDIIVGAWNNQRFEQHLVPFRRQVQAQV